MVSKGCIKIFLVAGLPVLLSLCTQKQKSYSMHEEIQLTSGLYGHMLNSAQAFSPDDQWVAYDTRNDQTHIGQTCCIEKVNLATGEVVRLYSTSAQTLHGPGVGAVAYNPVQEKMIFIHGLLNCDSVNPYGFTRRFGAILNEALPERIQHAEARTIQDPLIPGALRGGTHAHTWSGDGEWISFTYNDVLMENLEKTTQGTVKDLRTIGVMAPVKEVQAPEETPEIFSGRYFSIVAATVTEKPKPGSDEIERAFDECWIGTNGYVKADGTRQKRAIAFQGNVRTPDGSLLTEIFVADIPDDITHALPGKPLEGTLASRPCVPEGLAQRRITFTSGKKFPGVQGPRFWMRSAPDGLTLYFLMKDDQGIVQVFEVPTVGGDVRQVTHLQQPVQAQFNVSPDGKMMTIVADNSIWLTDIKSGTSSRITPATTDEYAPALGVLWNHKGNRLIYNRYVKEGEDRYLQIFKIDLN